MPNGKNNHFNWSWSPDRWQRLNTLIHDEAARIRVARRVLTLFGNSDGYVDNVVGHQVSEEPPLSIQAGQSLVPVEISVDFKLFPEQFNDEQAAMALATRAAYLVALAEDAVVLNGNRAREFLDRHHVSRRNLDQQTGLFGENQGTVGPRILDSVLEGITELRTRNHHGEYCVIVSPDLYQEAFKPRTNTLDAPIYEIRPLLKEGGFLYSPAAPERTGVIFSLGGHTIDIAVPIDAMGELTDEERGVALLRVVEQFRLRVNDPSAAVALS
jgi:uncharacterized linocin/CFP29 family protein